MPEALPCPRDWGAQTVSYSPPRHPGAYYLPGARTHHRPYPTWGSQQRARTLRKELCNTMRASASLLGQLRPRSGRKQTRNAGRRALTLLRAARAPPPDQAHYPRPTPPPTHRTVPRELHLGRSAPHRGPEQFRSPGNFPHRICPTGFQDWWGGELRGAGNASLICCCPGRCPPG